MEETKKTGNRSGIANYRKILEKNPKSFIFAKLAEEHLKLGEVEQAIEICKGGLQHNPDFADGQYVLGVALYKKGEKQAAEDIFFKILKKNPEHYLVKEALHRLGYDEDKIKKGLESVKEEQAISLEADEQDTQEDQSESFSKPVARTAPRKRSSSSAELRQRSRNAAREMQIARRSPVAEEEEVEDEFVPDRDKTKRPAWKTALILSIAIAIAAGVYFGVTAYMHKLAKEEIAELVLHSKEELKTDTFDAYRNTVEKLEKGLVKYKRSIDARTLMVMVYARLLLDFSPENLNWQDRMEQLYQSLPADFGDDVRILTARAFRGFALGKPGEVRFLLDTAREKGWNTDPLKCLEGELFLFDRKFDEAKKLFREVRESKPRESRILYKLAIAEIESGAKAEGLELLQDILKDNPKHKRAKLALLEAQMDSGQTPTDIFGKIESFANQSGEALPVIPRGRLTYLKGRIALERQKLKDALKLAEEAVRLDARAPHRYLLARVQHNLKHGEEARQSLLPAVQQQPENKSYRRLLALIYLSQNKKTEAIEQFDLAIDDATDDISLLVTAGDTAMKLRMFEKATFYYERAVFSNFSSIELHKKLILAQIEKRDLGEARKRINRFLAEKPDMALVHYLHGKLLIASGEGDKAYKALLKGADLDPENEDIQLELSRYELSLFEHKEGIQRLRDLLTRNPNQLEAMDLLASYALASGSFVEAREMYSRLVTLDPGSIAGKAHLAYVDYQIGQAEQAKNKLAEILQKHPQNGTAKLYLGVFSILEGDQKQAELQFQKIVRIAGKLPETHYWLGRLKLAQGERVWARSEFELALRIQPDYPRALYEIGLMLFVDGKIKQAVNMFNKSLKLLEQFPRATNYRAKIYCRLGEVDIFKGRQAAGIRRFKLANKLDPKDAEPYYLMAREGKKYANPQRSLRLLNKAIDLDSDFTVAYFEKAFILQSMGRKKDAAAQFEKYLKLAPNGEYSATARRELKKLQNGGK